MLRTYQQGGPDIVPVFAFDLAHADTMVPRGLSTGCCFGGRHCPCPSGCPSSWRLAWRLSLWPLPCTSSSGWSS